MHPEPCSEILPRPWPSLVTALHSQIYKNRVLICVPWTYYFNTDYTVDCVLFDLHFYIVNWSKWIELSTATFLKSFSR